MIFNTPIVGASLIALLVDRLVLERRLGTTPNSCASTKISMTFGYALPVLIVLTLSTVGTCALVNYVLQPLGVAYLQTMVFAMFIVATTLAGELLLQQWQSPEMRNRVSGRTAVIAAILGFLVLVPRSFSGPGAFSCAGSVFDAGFAGIVFCFVVFFWNGIREKIDLANETTRPLSLAQELVAASLIALVLLSVSRLRFFHGF